MREATTILRQIGLGSGLLLVLAWPAITLGNVAEDPIAASPPNAIEQQDLISAMRRYAAQYISNLPNFLCVQVTEQFEAGRKTQHWHRGDTLISRLTFNQGREQRKLELVNDKPPKLGGAFWRTPLTTEGEFGMLLESIFGEASAASFTWHGWDTVRSKRVAVFDYAIDRKHSTLSLSLSDLAQAIVPYHGSVYADPEAGAVWRITNSVTEIPAAIQTKSVSTTIEYDRTTIGSTSYLVPVMASISLFTGSNHIRNEIQFRDYRKFEADSTITYQSDGQNGNLERSKSTLPPVPPDL